MVTVTAVEDADGSDEKTTVDLSASGGDYGNASSSVSVTVTDDDTPYLVLSPRGLGVAEGGGITFKGGLGDAADRRSDRVGFER